MKICVFGLKHLGLVTSACLAKMGFDVVGLDPEEDVIYNLNVTDISIPVSEPNLLETIHECMFSRKLKFTTDTKEALKDAEIIWVTFDTPVDKNNNADELYVKQQIMCLYPYLRSKMTVLISSQLTVGTTRIIQEEYKRWFKGDVEFVYSPENLRHGKAIEIFNNPIRIIIGSEKKTLSLKLYNLLMSICTNLIWMSLESAEMTKHTLNSFLATEIAFINEISLICKKTGANIKDVEIGLKSDPRIGDKGFLNSGGAYSGGTLSRDVEYLYKISEDLNLKSTLIKSINKSNDNHKEISEK